MYQPSTSGIGSWRLPLKKTFGRTTTVVHFKKIWMTAAAKDTEDAVSNTTESVVFCATHSNNLVHEIETELHKSMQVTDPDDQIIEREPPSRADKMEIIRRSVSVTHKRSSNVSLPKPAKERNDKAVRRSVRLKNLTKSKPRIPNSVITTKQEIRRSNCVKPKLVPCEDLKAKNVTPSRKSLRIATINKSRNSDNRAVSAVKNEKTVPSNEAEASQVPDENFNMNDKVCQKPSSADCVRKVANICKTNQDRDEKFIVNLYESRPCRNRRSHTLAKTKKECEQLRANHNISLPVETLHIKESKTVVEEKAGKCIPLVVGHKHQDDDRFIAVRKKADFQCEIMKQASMALENCRGLANCDCRAEIEIEKLLLISTKSYELLIHEICQSAYFATEIKPEPKGVGLVEIARLKFDLKVKASDEWPEYFICLLSCGTTLKATELVKASGDSFTFSTAISFENLAPDFLIDAKLYCLKQNQTGNYWGTLINKYRNSKRMYPKRKIWYKDLNSAEAIAANILKTSFTQCGYFSLTKKDVNRKNHVKLISNISSGSTLLDAVEMTTELKDVQLRSQTCGFLTIAKQNHFAWERRWCVLDGTVLKIWNAPQDVDFRSPIEILDFDKCVSLTVENANRQLCPKPRTLVLEYLCDGRKNGMKQYFLNTDNDGDYEKWDAGFKEVVTFLHSWKM